MSPLTAYTIARNLLRRYLEMRELTRAGSAVTVLPQPISTSSQVRETPRGHTQGLEVLAREEILFSNYMLVRDRNQQMATIRAELKNIFRRASGKDTGVQGTW